MKWLEFSTVVENEVVESVAEIFTRYGHGGVSIEQGFQATADREGYTIDPTLPVTIRTYVPLDLSAPEKQAALAEALWHLGRIRPVAPLQTREIADEDWANSWKEHFHVHRVGHRVVIKPTWREYYPTPEDIVVELDPGMAFGTGLHPTTRMCLAVMERYVAPGMEILDLGTGSAILAIAAAKLGAKCVRAMDIDSVAVHAAVENVAMNGLTEVLSVEQASLPTDPDLLESSAEAFDLVLANIIANVIVELAPSLVAALRPNGILIASGIIDERLPNVLAALTKAEAEIVEVISENDWRTVIAKRRS